MSSRYGRYQERPQMTPAELDAYHIRQAQERQRRGNVGFTRPSREEALRGQTAGESALSRTQRYSQVDRRKGR